MLANYSHGEAHTQQQCSGHLIVLAEVASIHSCEDIRNMEIKNEQRLNASPHGSWVTEQHLALTPSK
jgi:hypothetical protein